MLINVTKPDLYSADIMKDIEDSYNKLDGHIVFLKDENKVYVVGFTRNGKRKLTEIPGANKFWDVMKDIASKE